MPELLEKILSHSAIDTKARLHAQMRPSYADICHYGVSADTVAILAAILAHIELRRHPRGNEGGKVRPIGRWDCFFLYSSS